jgi:hypothetical protein
MGGKYGGQKFRGQKFRGQTDLALWENRVIPSFKGEFAVGESDSSGLFTKLPDRWPFTINRRKLGLIRLGRSYLPDQIPFPKWHKRLPTVLRCIVFSKPGRPNGNPRQIKNEAHKSSFSSLSGRDTGEIRGHDTIPVRFFVLGSSETVSTKLCSQKLSPHHTRYAPAAITGRYGVYED